MRPFELAQQAREQVAEMTGLQSGTVTGLDRGGDDRWVVTVEVVELERIPNTMDVMGTFEVTLSEDGELVGLRRRGRRRRSQTDQGTG
ncbi:MAG: gas vesicle protein [Solirubrobacterales bacterium]|nr:gas vesicle protein [Microbacteriaceae bacterium]MCW3015215.1 gas vesicle protein [Solirubrobacterales bacterium]